MDGCLEMTLVICWTDRSRTLFKCRSFRFEFTLNGLVWYSIGFLDCPSGPTQTWLSAVMAGSTVMAGSPQWWLALRSDGWLSAVMAGSPQWWLAVRSDGWLSAGDGACSGIELLIAIGAAGHRDWSPAGCARRPPGLSSSSPWWMWYARWQINN